MRKLGVAIAAAAVLAIAWFKLPPLYRHVMALRLMHAAEQARARQDYEKAVDLYQLALLREPQNSILLGSYADLLDQIHRPEALQARVRIVQLDPGNTAARLDAVEAALKFRKINLARRLLSAGGKDMRNFERYYDLLGWMQFLSQDFPGADATWSNALLEHPGNKIYETNLATVRLSAVDETVRKEALKKLEAIVFGEKPPLSALLSLMAYASKSPTEPGDLDKWLERFKALVPETDPGYANYLDVLMRWRPERFQIELPDYLAAVSKFPDAIPAAQSWLISCGLYNEFQTFRKSLPPALQDNLEGTLMEAEALFGLKQYDALNTFLGKEQWNDIPPLKMAWLERLRRATASEQDPGLGRLKWQVILNNALRIDARGRYSGLLTKMAFDWHWSGEYEDSLWIAAKQIPGKEADALDDLYQFYLRTRNASGMQKVLAQQMSLEPDNPDLQNNFAFLSFLLGVDMSKAAKISTELCAKYPKTPVYLSTRAFGFLKAGRLDEGLALFGRMDPRQLMGTAPGVCYGYLLAASGKPGALDYLKDAERWIIFPEEMQMLRDARSEAGSTGGS